MLELTGLRRTFGEVVALDDVSFVVPAGEIVGFVGPNGAGKTTAMRIALGVLTPDAGQVRWRGEPIDARVRRRSGYMPEERGLYPKMRVLDQLVYLARLHGLATADARRRALETLEVLGVAERRSDRVESLSLGNQQRVQLAAALVHEPDLLVLDEPFSGLDPVGVDVLSGVLRRQAANHGVPVVFSSHQLDLVERLCDRVVLIDHGRVVAQGTIDELRARRERRLFLVQVSGADDELDRLDPRRAARGRHARRPRARARRRRRRAARARPRPLLRRRRAVRPGAPEPRRAVPGGGRRMSAADPRPTDRGAWRLVAARDFTVRLRDKGFFISTAITLTVLTVFILLRAFGGSSTPSFDLAITGAEPDRIDALAAEIESAATRRRVEVDDPLLRRRALGGSRRARGAGRRRPAGDGRAHRRRVGARRAHAGRAGRRRAGAPHARRSPRAAPPPRRSTPCSASRSIEVRTLEPQDPNRDENAGIAFIAVLLAYGQLFGYGVWVATGVIEEKASRVVEILLSAIRPRQLLAGKIAGIGLLGIVQLACIATFAIVLSLVTGALELPGTAVGIALVVLAWFVMGFAFYAGLFAVSGSLVSRMEELQNAMVPINLIIFVSFFISIGALENPDSTLSVVASVLPFSSALAMPVRIALGVGDGRRRSRCRSRCSWRARPRSCRCRPACTRGRC